MTREDLFTLLPNIITGYDGVTYLTNNEDWFDINVNGAIYPNEIDELRKYCFVSCIVFDLIKRRFEISCTDK